MSPTEFQTLSIYVADIQFRMKLADWSIRVCHTPCGDSAHAEISCTAGRKVAELWVGAAFWLSPSDQKRHTIVHELCHIHLWPIFSATRGLKSIVGTPLYRSVKLKQREAVEFAVDAIADAFAPYMPAWPDEDSE